MAAVAGEVACAPGTVDRGHWRVAAVLRAADGAVQFSCGTASGNAVREELTGPRPDLATLGGVAFSVTGLAGMIAVPLLGKHSDEIGYRRVLLICLLGATLTSLPQGFAQSYWVFALERFGVGLFIGGILPTANALIGRMVAAV